MSQRRQQLIHPFTFFLVNDVQLAYENAYASRSMSSINALYWLTMSLDQKGQEALKEEMKTMEAVIDGKQTLSKELERQLYSKVMQELHKEGYFLAAKMTPPTKTTTMKELGMDMEVARHAAHRENPS